jgi:hypothetical protein
LLGLETPAPSETQLIDFPELVVVCTVCDDADFGASLEQQFKDLREFINQFDFVLKCFVVHLKLQRFLIGYPDA